MLAFRMHYMSREAHASSYLTAVTEQRISIGLDEDIFLQHLLSESPSQIAVYISCLELLSIRNMIAHTNTFHSVLTLESF